MSSLEIVNVVNIRYRVNGENEDTNLIFEIEDFNSADELKTSIIEKMKLNGLGINSELVFINDFYINEIELIKPWGNNDFVKECVNTYSLNIEPALKIKGQYYKLLPYETEVL